MKAAARQSLNCIENKIIKYGEKRFSICRMEVLYNRLTTDLHLQCGTITTLISLGDCTLQIAMWHVL